MLHKKCIFKKKILKKVTGKQIGVKILFLFFKMSFTYKFWIFNGDLYSAYKKMIHTIQMTIDRPIHGLNYQYTF